jgi:hypothetical protein
MEQHPATSAHQITGVRVAMLQVGRDQDLRSALKKLADI